ncbi:venom acid phosphatase Acph-1 isoform X1 [Stomoxys calcitrans]|uniref:venom acid phosphatase Acph-1 isoform X1 n=1 Tax=Stomoxys calcitrans TaxID=35570 RepID=UPI0027E2C531|nr:venom acid phosphatase Acph-1 isoform X1 [Stomoxys calcitrans]
MLYREKLKCYLIKFFLLISLAMLIGNDWCGAHARKVLLIKETSSNNRSTTLKLVHVLFRHGPRTPVNTYPNDPYVNETFFPYGWGHLTNDAKKELFTMGNSLALRYQDLTKPYYKPDMIYAQSSESPRTMMSISVLLAGLLPPVHTPMEWNFKLNWQPIPIFVKPAESDIWLRMTAKCPRYDQALEEVLQQTEVKLELNRYETMFEELTYITGKNISSAADINSLYITLLAEQMYGLQLPSWTEHYYPERLQYLAEQNYIYNAYTMEMQRIKSGPFLQQIIRQMEAYVEGTLIPEERKIFIYCGHDWTITNVLLALKVWKRQMPRFSALITFELHQREDTKNYFVELYFQNDPESDLKPLVLPGCNFQCPLDKFVQLTKEIIPTQSYDEMCRLK